MSLLQKLVLSKLQYIQGLSLPSLTFKHVARFHIGNTVLISVVSNECVSLKPYNMHKINEINTLYVFS